MRAQDRDDQPARRQPQQAAPTARQAASASPTSAHSLLALQRSAGNAAVVQLMRQAGMLADQRPQPTECRVDPSDQVRPPHATSVQRAADKGKQPVRRPTDHREADPEAGDPAPSEEPNIDAYHLTPGAGSSTGGSARTGASPENRQIANDALVAQNLHEALNGPMDEDLPEAPLIHEQEEQRSRTPRRGLVDPSKTGVGQQGYRPDEFIRRAPRNFDGERAEASLRHLAIRLHTFLDTLHNDAGESEVQAMVLNRRIVISTNINESIERLLGFDFHRDTFRLSHPEQQRQERLFPTSGHSRPQQEEIRRRRTDAPRKLRREAFPSGPQPALGTPGESSTDQLVGAMQNTTISSDSASPSVPQRLANVTADILRSVQRIAEITLALAHPDPAHAEELRRHLVADDFENSIILLRTDRESGRSDTAVHAEQKLIALLRAAGITFRDVTGEFIIRGTKRPCQACGALLRTSQEHFSRGGVNLSINPKPGRYYANAVNGVGKHTLYDLGGRTEDDYRNIIDHQDFHESALSFKGANPTDTTTGFETGSDSDAESDYADEYTRRLGSNHQLEQIIAPPPRADTKRKREPSAAHSLSQAERNRLLYKRVHEIYEQPWPEAPEPREEGEVRAGEHAWPGTVDVKDPEKLAKVREALKKFDVPQSYLVSRGFLTKSTASRLLAGPIEAGPSQAKKPKTLSKEHMASELKRVMGDPSASRFVEWLTKTDRKRGETMPDWGEAINRLVLSWGRAVGGTGLAGALLLLLPTAKVGKDVLNDRLKDLWDHSPDNAGPGDGAAP